MSERMKAPAAEVGAASVDGHEFRPDGEWWRRCAVCHLSEAAHVKTMIVRPVELLAHRCPECVALHVDPCPHSPPPPVE